MPLAAYGSRAELTALGSPELSPDREADDRRNASVSPLSSRSFGSPDVAECRIPPAKRKTGPSSVSNEIERSPDRNQTAPITNDEHPVGRARRGATVLVWPGRVQ